MDRFALPDSADLDYYDAHFGERVQRANIPRDPESFRRHIIAVFSPLRPIEIALVRAAVPAISIYRAPGGAFAYKGHAIALSNEAQVTKLADELPVRFDKLGYQFITVQGVTPKDPHDLKARRSFVREALFLLVSFCEPYKKYRGKINYPRLSFLADTDDGAVPRGNGTDAEPDLTVFLEDRSDHDELGGPTKLESSP